MGGWVGGFTWSPTSTQSSSVCWKNLVALRERKRDFLVWDCREVGGWVVELDAMLR